jgi:hypothetical protein
LPTPLVGATNAAGAAELANVVPAGSPELKSVTKLAAGTRTVLVISAAVMRLKRDVADLANPLRKRVRMVVLPFFPGTRVALNPSAAPLAVLWFGMRVCLRLMISSPQAKCLIVT